MIEHDEELQTLTLSNGYGYASGYGPTPTSATDLTLGNITVTSGGTGYQTGAVGATSATSYTIGSMPLSNTVWTTNGTGVNWSAVGANIKPSATISLKGEEADIDLNGKSMKAWMEKVEERLNILIPNPELEKDWDDLRELGERYRELEKKCKEKAKVWAELNKVQPKHG